MAASFSSHSSSVVPSRRIHSPKARSDRGRATRPRALTCLGEATRRLETGDGFFEPARRAILKFDNASDSEPAEIVCFDLADAADQPAIEMLEGGMARQLGQH